CATSVPVACMAVLALLSASGRGQAGVASAAPAFHHYRRPSASLGVAGFASYDDGDAGASS
ncbi:hypothetical protein TRAPUB_12809, partial [Trametes pubescens]